MRPFSARDDEGMLPTGQRKTGVRLTTFSS